MPPETDSPERVSGDALALWKKLSGLYDEIETALRDDGGHADLANLGRAIVAVEGELRPVVAHVGEIRSALATPSPSVQQMWDESDALIASLAERQPTLTRAALAARDGASRALARVRGVRMESGPYRHAPKGSPRFASRQA